MKFTIGKKMVLGFGLVIVALATIAIVNYAKINELRGMQDEGAKRAEDAVRLQEMAGMTDKMYSVIADAVINSDLDNTRRDWAELKEEMSSDLKQVTELADTPEEKKWAAEGEEAIHAIVNLFETEMMNELSKEPYEGQGAAIQALDGRLDTYKVKSNELYTKMAESLTAEMKAEDKIFDETASFGVTLSITVALIGLLASLIIAFLITRGITGPLARIVAAARGLAEGDINQKVEVNSTDEVGELAEAFAQLIEAQQSKATVAEQIAEGNLGMKVEVASTKDTLGKSMETMRNAINLLAVDVSELVAAAGDGKLDSRADASKHRGDFRKIVEGVNDTITNIVSPLMVTADYVDKVSKGVIPPAITTNYKGQYNIIKDNLNAMVKMMNELLAETDKIIIAAGDGQLDQRADASKFVGGWNKLVSGVNDTITNIVGPLMVTATYVDKISKGDIPDPITDNYKGQYNVIKNNLNQCIQAVGLLVTDVNTLAQAAVEGRLQTRADASKHQGDFKKIVQGVNMTLDAVLDPINEAAQVLDQLANYNLTARVTGNYQGDHAKIKESLNTTAAALHDSMSQVAEAADQVSSASTQIASSSQQVAEGTSEQASALEETSSALEEMAGMTKQNADNTQQAKGLSETTRAAAVKGADAMGNMLGSMDKIKKAAEGTAAIIKDINDIAFQTNLLALNAAVEAARAGDAGRGFAVVAEEVRNLAGRAKEAAKNTEDLIKESVRLADEGQNISGQVNENLSEIVGSVGKVTDIVAEIAVASQEQARGIEQVNKAITEMDKVVQAAAANSEESSSAAEELAGQSQEMAAMVGRFKLNRSVSNRAQSKQPSAAKKAAPKKTAAAKSGTPSNGSGHIDAYNLSPEAVIPLDSDPDFAEF